MARVEPRDVEYKDAAASGIAWLRCGRLQGRTNVVAAARDRGPWRRDREGPYSSAVSLRTGYVVVGSARRHGHRGGFLPGGGAGGDGAGAEYRYRCAFRDVGCL